MHCAHPAPAATARGLDDHRVTDIPCDPQVVLEIVAQRTSGSRHARDPSLLHGADGGNLIPHQADRLRSWTDEYKPTFLDTLCKISILREKSIAGMDPDRICDLGGANDRSGVQVAFSRGRWPNAHRFIGQPDVLEIPVRGRMYGDRLDPHLAAGAQDPERDLPAVGNHNLVKHGPALPRSLKQSRTLDDQQGLAIFHGVPVFHEQGSDHTIDIRFDLIHDLHGLDDAHDIPTFDGLADADKRGAHR